MDDADNRLITELSSALRSGVTRYSASDGREYTREGLREKLQELIPTEIVVKRICDTVPAIVVAAPHVSFDNWTEYFANRLAADLSCGEVLARNFRDDDGNRIPASIGRHIHVNRPTESEGRRSAEHETDRAQIVFRAYVKALQEACGGFPLTLLIELHGHRRHANIEVATAGIDAGTAHAIKQDYYEVARLQAEAPELAIEPIDKLRYLATRAKQIGSLHRDVCQIGMHIEIPRRCRETKAARENFRPTLTEWIRRSVTHLT